MTSGTPRPRRPRDPEASRAAILSAAREVFTELGYDGASIREIARRAGAANGLVLRHFTSKELLFLASFSPGSELAASAGSGGTGLEELLARVVGDDPSASPFLALIRSAVTRPELAAQLRDRMRAPARDLLAGGAPVADGEMRVDLFGAVMIGLTFVRHVLGAGPLAEASPAELATVLDPVVHAVLATSPTGGDPPGS